MKFVEPTTLKYSQCLWRDRHRAGATAGLCRNGGPLAPLKLERPTKGARLFTCSAIGTIFMRRS